MAVMDPVTVDLDLSKFRVIGHAEHTFSLLLRLVTDPDVKVRPEWLHEARQVCTAILGYSPSAPSHSATSDGQS